jgi:DegV family protein with EDD domain
VSPGANTAVVCDTTAYLPTELSESNGIELISLYVSVNGEQERESEVSDLGEFYDRLRTSEAGATTSQPSVGDFVGVYEPLLAEGRDIVSLHLSAGISGTCEAANQARARLEAEGKGGERIRVFDSRSAAGGLGLCALGAAAVAASGGDGDTVLARAQQTREALKIWFAVDTLEYLRRGGRIGGAQAWIGSTLRIKPILAIESEIVPIERVRTWGRAFERMVDHLSALREDGNDRFFIQHIQAADQAAKLAQRGEAIYGRPPEFVSEIGPVIGAHVGPGLFGVTALPGEVLGPV